jgi:gliding motility-associated-like protein
MEVYQHRLLIIPATSALTGTTTYCSSEPVVVEIKDERMVPEVMIEEDNPLTNCWITDPNGQFSATVNGMVGGYTFEWYIGTDTTGIPDHVEATYSGLSPQSYTLVVTDNLTSCAAVRSVDLTDRTIAPPVADPEVVQHLLSCIELDGWVRASVGGNTIDYTFDWSDGSSVNNPSDWRGINYRDLDAGIYTVTAQDMITGCISDGRQVEVLDQREMPMFSFDVVPAHCENSDGSVEIVWENDVPIGNTTWYDSETGQHIETGSAIYEYPPGWYEVVVTSSYGCEEIQEVEIPTEIFEFNGISANGDGRNDYFDIACISMFPDNHVRIYNRAGQLVYEEFGYNNMDKAFTGIGENGVYLAGRELPDGTYFYIIDKRDGTDAIAGYLELIR